MMLIPRRFLILTGISAGLWCCLGCASAPEPMPEWWVKPPETRWMEDRA